MNLIDHFNGQFKAGALCWLCRFATSYLLSSIQKLQKKSLLNILFLNFLWAEVKRRCCVGTAMELVSLVGS